MKITIYNIQQNTKFNKIPLHLLKSYLKHKLLKIIKSNTHSKMEDGAPHMAKSLLEELAHKVTFMK